METYNGLSVPTNINLSKIDETNDDCIDTDGNLAECNYPDCSDCLLDTRNIKVLRQYQKEFSNG